MDLLAWQKGISSLGKNDKRENSQKVGLKKWNLEALKKGKNKGQPSRNPLERESQLEAFEE